MRSYFLIPHSSFLDRGTKISALKPEIKKIKCLPMLRGLILKDTPVAKEEEYRIEVIMNIRNLERLDKDIFTDEERQEAQEVGSINKS